MERVWLGESKSYMKLKKFNEIMISSIENSVELMTFFKKNIAL